MAIKQVMAVFDSATQTYGAPICVPAVGVGTRSFVDIVNDPREENNIARHPQDFELRHIAEFDDATGQFIPQKEVRTVCRAIDVKRSV